MLAVAGDQTVGGVAPALFEIGEQARIGQVERFRTLPVGARDLVQPLDQRPVVGLDRELAPRVEAAGREVDRADQRALAALDALSKGIGRGNPWDDLRSIALNLAG